MKKFGLFLGSLDTVLGTGTAAFIHTTTVKCTTDNVVAYPGKILDTATPNKDDAMLLEAVALVGDVGNDFNTSGKPHFSHFPDCRIRLLRGTGHDLNAHTATKGISLEGTRFGFRLDNAAWIPD